MKKFLSILPIILITGYWLLVTANAAVLSDADIAAYTAAFADARAGRATVPAVSDDVLLADVKYELFMSKTYRTPGADAADWMNTNYDRPGADNIEKLAKRKGAKNVRAAKLPRIYSPAAPTDTTADIWTAKSYSGNTLKSLNKFKSALRAGNTKNAKNILITPAFRSGLTSADWGRLAGRLAFIYYADGYDDLAREYCELGASRDSEYGLWTCGLLAFKSGDFAASQDYFGHLTELPQTGDARKTESAFWAGRAAYMGENYGTARGFWRIAAAHPHTFYGALAAAQLGDAPEYEFFDAQLSDDDIWVLEQEKFGRIALALTDIGETERAGQYLRYMLTANIDDELLNAIHGFAGTFEMPRASMASANIVRARGITEINPDIIFSAQYPLPDWEPLGGWSVDRALLFAIVRQESVFQPAAQSGRGATGVMQVMPGTARAVARKNDAGPLDMTNPEHNMFIGQQYIVDLLTRPDIDNNIIKMLVSYNAGAGAMSKWEKKFSTDDPLLYIESFSFAETRNYVKRVLANLWLYRAKLGQSSDDAEKLANGIWPKYSSQDRFAEINSKYNEI
ncbi:MAG: lytic transglycosylase domain-containing protein [Rickettsiales bacterium]|jgi:soluble lytic murein transglycosylase-like protein|nr:lytic transglycosylase domain-containing protein [Rickettsiales bacterium]